jgi:hypothetical protein
VEPQHNTRPPADAALDAMLIKRGWDLLDRAENADIYDWCASYCMEAGEVTYLIVDAPDNQAFSDRYRICMINGERRTYEIVDGLLVDLDAIEARRCEDRGAQDRRRRSRGDA